MKPLALVAFVSLSSFVFAQSGQFEDPYAIQSNGVLQGIAWKSKGGHRVVLDDKGNERFQNVSFNLSIFGNDAFFDTVVRSRFPVGYTPVFSLTALRSAQGGGNLAPANSTAKGAKTGFKASHITFGGGSTRVDRESRGITVTGESVDLQPESGLITKEMTTMAKRQKLWTCSAFRISVAGSVIDDALSFDAIDMDWVPFGDLDGDGVLDMALVGDSFAFEIPKFSKYGSTIFETALASTRAGSPKELPVKVEYLDEDGLTVLSLSFVVIVNGMGPSDMFFDAAAPSNNVRVSTKIKRNLAIEMERKSSGF